jgi:hypothetical protein
MINVIKKDDIYPIFNNYDNIINLKITHNNNNIFNFNNMNEIRKALIDDSKNRGILIKAGLFDLRITFRPNLPFRSQFSSIDILDSREQNLHNFFNSLMKLNYTFYITPDTNFLINGFYSNYLKPLIRNRPTIRMQLSRITLLELERMCNSSENDEQLINLQSMLDKIDTIINRLDGIVKQVSLEKSNYESATNKIQININRQKRETESLNRQLIKKRNAFFALNEAYSMIEDGAYVLPHLEYPIIDYLRGYNSLISDSLIRLELSTNLKDNPTSYFFLSSDFTNAITASAEGINSIYLYPNTLSIIENVQTILNNLIYFTTIEYGNCEVESTLQGDKNTIKFYGIWNGKNFFDWKENNIQYEIK